MSRCIIGHDYAIVYDLEILPINPQELGKKHEEKIKAKLTLDESKKWFNDELRVGENRPLLSDFIELAKQNDKGGRVCFLISLNKYGESGIPFQLRLLKRGKELKTNFRAPQKIWKMDFNTDDIGVDTAEMTVYFDKEGLPVNKHEKSGNKKPTSEFKYELWATYFKLKENVSSTI